MNTTSRQIGLFLLMAFGFSWSHWGLNAYLTAQGSSLPLPWLGSFGPFLAALIMTRWEQGQGAIRPFLARMLPRTRYTPLYLLAFLLPPLTNLLVVILVSVRTGQSLGLPSDVNVESLLGFLLFFPIIFVFGGPLGEEPGWRGYLQGKVQTQLGLLQSSLVIGFLWFAWHLPLFFLDVGGSSQKGLSVPLYMVYVLSVTMIYSIMHRKSQQNLFTVLLLHTSNNWSSVVVLALYPSILAQNNNMPYMIEALLVLVIAAIFFFTQRAALPEAIPEGSAAP